MALKGSFSVYTSANPNKNGCETLIFCFYHLVHLPYAPQTFESCTFFYLAFVPYSTCDMCPTFSMKLIIMASAECTIIKRAIICFYVLPIIECDGLRPQRPFVIILQCPFVMYTYPAFHQ